MFNKKLYSIWALLVIFALPESAFAMHIMEGFLPYKWAAFWALVSLPVVVRGVISISKKRKRTLS